MRSGGKFLPILLAGLVLGACDDGGPETGRLVINLTDAPGNLDAAWVSVREVVLFGAEGDESVEGRVVLAPMTTEYIDLLKLTNGDVMKLVDATVTTGIYSELRLVIDEAYVVTGDGEVFATAGAVLPDGVVADGVLRCPSCSSSGFKVKLMDGGLDVQDNARVTIDFDVNQSFGHLAGQSGAWIMHPVLRATSTTTLLATIEGTVTLADGAVLPATCGGLATSVAQFRPMFTLGSDSFTATPDAEGAYRIGHLMPGGYTAGSEVISFANYQEKLTFTATPSVAAPTLEAGQTHTVDFTVTGATCE